VRLRGSIDRIDLVAPAGGIVVDFKTAKTPAGIQEGAANVQLALYQLVLAEDAVSRAGAVDGVRLQPAGAELLYLRVLDKDQLPKTRYQPALVSEPDDEPEGESDDVPDPISTRTGLTATLADVVRDIRAERFPARPDDRRCKVCDVRAVCPAVTEGIEVPT